MERTCQLRGILKKILTARTLVIKVTEVDFLNFCDKTLEFKTAMGKLWEADDIRPV